MMKVLFCEECDAIITKEDEVSTPVMMVTGHIGTATEKYYVCKICGHRQIDKDSVYRTG